jgi:hypothetical protein
MTSGEQMVKWELAGEIAVLREKPAQRHIFHHKTHMLWPGTASWKLMTNHLSYGIAQC